MMIQDPTCSLVDKHCVPCEGGAVPLTQAQFAPLLTELQGWEVVGGQKISKDYQFANFVKAVEFINQVSKIAESEGHHPDIYLHDFKFVKLELWTHAIGGLSENDFIVAAKIDRGINTTIK